MTTRTHPRRQPYDVEWCEAIVPPTKAEEIRAMKRTGEYKGCVELIDFYVHRFNHLPIISVPHPKR